MKIMQLSPSQPASEPLADSYYCMGLHGQTLPAAATSAQTDAWRDGMVEREKRGTWPVRPLE